MLPARAVLYAWRAVHSGRQGCLRILKEKKSPWLRHKVTVLTNVVFCLEIPSKTLETSGPRKRTSKRADDITSHGLDSLVASFIWYTFSTWRYSFGCRLRRRRSYSHRRELISGRADIAWLPCQHDAACSLEVPERRPHRGLLSAPGRDVWWARDCRLTEVAEVREWRSPLLQRSPCAEAQIPAPVLGKEGGLRAAGCGARAGRR